jgi:siroheme synthase-like protein
MSKKDPKPPVYYPIFLNIQGKKCVVVGGGQVALRKIKMLIDCKAKVTVITPALHPALEQLVESRAIRLIERNYKPGDLEDSALVIAATDTKGVNKRVAHDAKKQGIIVNVADDPELSDYIVPSFFKRGNLTVAVSTAGVSPALARKIRTKLEKNFGEEYASLLSLIGEVRSTLKEKAYTVDTEVWQRALDLDLLIQQVRSRQWKKAKAILLRKLQANKRKKRRHRDKQFMIDN